MWQVGCSHYHQRSRVVSVCCTQTPKNIPLQQAAPAVAEAPPTARCPRRVCPTGPASYKYPLTKKICKIGPRLATLFKQKSVLLSWVRRSVVVRVPKKASSTHQRSRVVSVCCTQTPKNIPLQQARASSRRSAAHRQVPPEGVPNGPRFL